MSWKLSSFQLIFIKWWTVFNTFCSWNHIAPRSLHNCYTSNCNYKSIHFTILDSLHWRRLVKNIWGKTKIWGSESENDCDDWWIASAHYPA